jgi:Fur family ferric uptake transcriptional regulator
MSWTERVLDGLAQEGHRLTGPRRHILNFILRYAVPFTAEELIADLHGAGIQVGRATVYRTLELLQTHQWLRLVHRPEGEHGYVVGEPGHQHHLVCRSCSAVIAFEGCEIESLLGGLAERLHFNIEGHWVEAFGTCRACQMNER